MTGLGMGRIEAGDGVEVKSWMNGKSGQTRF